MAKDEGTEDRKIYDPNPSRRTTTRSGVTGVMSRGIKSEIALNSEIRRGLLR